MEIVRTFGHARAGLIGNPSDGYNGKTISLLIKNFSAKIILYEWEEMEIILSQEDHSRFRSIGDLVKDVELHGYYGGIRLIKATIKRFYEFCEAQTVAGLHGFKLHDRNFSIRYESNIPRQVGMAGSSAIIVATLDALCNFYDISIPREVLPSLALSVERDELRIPAGLQDRVIQVYKGLVYMDFSREAMHMNSGFECGLYTPIDPSLLPPLYVAFTADVGEPTEVLHTPLRALYNEGDPKVVGAMTTFANYTVEAHQALLTGNHAQLHELINANFDLRASICNLAPEHQMMVEVARSVGASGKYAGSGGAIVGTYRDEAMYQQLEHALSEIGCHVFKPTIAT